MASVCFYFQVHQPFRLRRFSVFDRSSDYFDDERNRQICRKVAEKCYLPANAVIEELATRYAGRFRVAYSLTGCVIDQFRLYAPEVLESFQRLARTGAVEFLSETYYHSLSLLYSREEFAEQVALHRRTVQELFGQTPRVFRNTELIYSNDLARIAAQMGYNVVLCEGADNLLGYRSPTYLYTAPDGIPVRLLLKNYRLADDIAFRFGNKNWSEWPLTADKFARWVDQINGHGYVVNLFMDYETFGEHQWAETGIFEFLRHMPSELFKLPGNDFKSPSECAATYPASGEYDVPHLISWADTERDLSAWLGNAMQSNALHELYKLEPAVKACGDPTILRDWRRLQSSDHFYYMCTKFLADGTVHQYFNPYDSPYDSYINFMNVLDHLRSRLPKQDAEPAPRPKASRAKSTTAAPTVKAGRKPRSQKPKAS
ncbi:MAG: glycoside hydrolase family 57 protein [Phycisphaerae bacterium]|jgi:alpha-amylase|nr:glycoside hydrolase family 57 protein [Phycisphaerae bacterium]HOO18056.1 glycoside hydrolase family 57 protein [Phycisphaerae bacterium]HPC22499.1 glycoside hydrolase family 57 protein [Phycisphaerae bacterium]HRS28439.1 glycoside hydrolase family 57 protein [Phycisphaerae bacterium]HRT42328.1 glycoside hydrolase family 57 protein [Phycisphaerae bacterium]